MRLGVPSEPRRHICEMFNRRFLELGTVYVCADRFVKEGLRYVAIHVLGCSVRSGCPFSGYQHGGQYAVSVCRGQGWSVALHRTEQPLLKDTMAVPQAYMAPWPRRDGLGAHRGGE